MKIKGGLEGREPRASKSLGALEGISYRNVSLSMEKSIIRPSVRCDE